MVMLIVMVMVMVIVIVTIIVISTVNVECKAHGNCNGITDFLHLLQVNIGDHVKVCPDDDKSPLFVCRIAYMWQKIGGKPMFHSQWL